MSSTFAAEKVESWLGTHGYCFPGELYRLTPADPLKTRCVDAWTQYSVCFTISLGMNFRVPWVPIVNEGPGEPYFVDETYTETFNDVERAIFVGNAFLGVMVGLYLTGAFVAVISHRDGLSISEQVTQFCQRYKVGHKEHRAMQEYFQSLKELRGVIPQPELFYKLSPVLANKVILQIHGVCKAARHKLACAHVTDTFASLLALCLSCKMSPSCSRIDCRVAQDNVLRSAQQHQVVVPQGTQACA